MKAAATSQNHQWKTGGANCTSLSSETKKRYREFKTKSFWGLRSLIEGLWSLTRGPDLSSLSKRGLWSLREEGGRLDRAVMKWHKTPKTGSMRHISGAASKSTSFTRRVICFLVPLVSRCYIRMSKHYSRDTCWAVVKETRSVHNRSKTEKIKLRPWNQQK